MLKILLQLSIVFVLFSCSTLQQSEEEGEYRYVPITDRLKSLSEEDFASRLRSASLTCENEMLTVYVPSRVVDEACLLYTSPSPRDLSTSRMPSSA